MNAAAGGQGTGRTRQEILDAQNAEFWNTLCGTLQAQKLGIRDGSPESLAKFDAWYLDFYPYLLRHVPVHTMRDKDVLEVGLGYGTLSQCIAGAGANYRGLDIAAGPVQMVNARLAQSGLRGEAVQGSMLSCPFPDASFDCVVSIGCFHHTGDMQRCVDETFRVLRPGGRAYLMVYNRFSYRQWRRHPVVTWRAWRAERSQARLQGASSERQRAAYDVDTEGRAAPETEFYSAGQIRRMMARFSQVDCHLENCDAVALPYIGELIPRKWLLAPVGRSMGLDVYIHAAK